MGAITGINKVIIELLKENNTEMEGKNTEMT